MAEKPRQCKSLRSWCLYVPHQFPQIITKRRLLCQCVQRHTFAQSTLVDEDKAITYFVQQFDVIWLVRMQADKYKATLAFQTAKEIQHKADVAILRVEPRFSIRT